MPNPVQPPSVPDTLAAAECWSRGEHGGAEWVSEVPTWLSAPLGSCIHADSVDLLDYHVGGWAAATGFVVRLRLFYLC